MKRKLIITAALSGGGMATKENNPNIPYTPEEIADAAYKSWQAGVAVVHIHGRNPDGKVTSDPEVYKKIHKLIREKCDVIIQDSTGLGAHVSTEDRVKVIEAGAEMASLNMGTMVRTGWDESIFLNTPTMIETYVKKMQELNIVPEMEVFSHSMMRDVESLINKGLVKKPYVINFVLGSAYQGTLEATVKNLRSLIDYLPEGAIFNVSATGRYQLPLTTLGMLMGGNVRVGLEDNLYYKKGVLATNEMLVERVVRLAKELLIEVASPKEVRDYLGIPQLKE